MKIGIIGTGYVGLPTGAGLADWGNEVICVDKDENKISRLKEGHTPSRIEVVKDKCPDFIFRFSNSSSPSS